MGFENNKFYHFWSEVFFAFHLRTLGHSKFAVTCGLSGVGCAYELGTSKAGVQFYQAFGLDFLRALCATRLFQDIQLHFRGVMFGLNLFTQCTTRSANNR